MQYERVTSDSLFAAGYGRHFLSNITSILVLSGETKRGDLAAAQITPDFVFENVGELADALRASDQIRR